MATVVNGIRPMILPRDDVGRCPRNDLATTWTHVFLARGLAGHRRSDPPLHLNDRLQCLRAQLYDRNPEPVLRPSLPSATMSCKPRAGA